MARFRGSNWKKSRRLGISLSGTGKELEKRPYAPGQHGPNQRKKLSEYGLQLREKQKLRYFDADSLKGTFVRFPERSELPAEINEQLIVEYYSR